MAKAPRIALIHATAVAVDPIGEAFARLWPEAERVNLLDDSLSVDRAKAAELTPAMFARFDALADYAADIGSDAILFTCSAFGPAIEAIARRMVIPVLKPNEAMFEEALALGGRIGMIATFGPSIDTMEAEFAEDAARLRPGATITSVLVGEAMTALRAGDSDTHNRLVAEAVPGLPEIDALMLAQFSTARALPLTQTKLHCPVLSSPEAAVRKIRTVLGA